MKIKVTMLPKLQRLNKVEVELVFKKGKSLGTRYFFIRNRKNYLDRSRFCIVFDKKISLKSHERILTKRRIYDSIRRNLDILKSHFDVAFIVKPSFMKLPRKQIEPAVIEALKNLAII